MANTFHCKTPDCGGWTIYDDDVNVFKCPLCTKINCLTCQVICHQINSPFTTPNYNLQAIHDGQDCKQYQQKVLLDSMDENSRKTKIWMDVSFVNVTTTTTTQIVFYFHNFMKDLIEKGEALNCPSCQVLLLKKWGCDWVRCTYCRTEICWVTRQLRWGPGVSGIKIQTLLECQKNIFSGARGHQWWL